MHKTIKWLKRYKLILGQIYILRNFIIMFYIILYYIILIGQIIIFTIYNEK